MTDTPVQTVHSTFVIERTYPAPAARVFNAFADPAIKRKWFIEGEGWELPEDTDGFRTGGLPTSRFTFQGGPEITNDTQYQDIVPDRRIVWAYRMAFAGNALSASLATVDFTPAEGGGTLMTYTEQGAYFDGADSPKNREVGCRELFEALAKYL